MHHAHKIKSQQGNMSIAVDSARRGLETRCPDGRQHICSLSSRLEFMRTRPLIQALAIISTEGGENWGPTAARTLSGRRHSSRCIETPLAPRALAGGER